MRLNNYLTEIAPVTRQLLNIKLADIHDKCKPYIKLLKSAGIDYPFYRGSSFGKPWFQERDTNQDREPKGMSPILFDELNKILKKYGHTTRNNSVSATSSERHAQMFGKIYFLFPIGKFNYTWIKNKDINFTNIERDLLNYIRTEKEDKRTHVLAAENIASNFYTNKSINIPYTYEYEIWFDCKKYILLSKDAIDIYGYVSQDLLGR